MKKKEIPIPVVVLKERTGFSAFCPVIDGVAVTDKTIDRTLKRMKDALEFHIEGLQLAKAFKTVSPEKTLKKSFEDYGTDAFYATIKIAA